MVTTDSHRHHDMPFGATLLDDGRVRFRLWAPSAKSVEVVLNEFDAGLQMAAEQEGWFGIITEMATAGSLYQYRIDNELLVPDPASRFQPQDVNGPSQVMDSRLWSWKDTKWQGRPWEETVLYELHVGSFTPEGTFKAVTERLDYLHDLGITAIELMPVADFPGERNWGYDGVLPFAPDSIYGTPDDLKQLIETAHARGLMVFLDVVYNHFGPDGNYLHAYASSFFTERHHTPWGAAINFDDENSRHVRNFFIQNALYWLEEFNFDGLRLDAVHAIKDDSETNILVKLGEAVHQGPGMYRHIHLVLENDDNATHYLQRDNRQQPQQYTAQWNDDIHHALHSLITGELHGYYHDYADMPARHLARCLAEGFAYQGEASAFHDGQSRGESCRGLSPMAFVNFLQNHDQVGNRAFGERITQLVSPQALRAATAVLLLAPSPPLLFMGQEWGSKQPFPFFCNFKGELADKVVEGRRKEFAKFPEFTDSNARKRIPDPGAIETFKSAVLDWQALEQDEHVVWLDYHRELLTLRKQKIVPLLAEIKGNGVFEFLPPTAMQVRWKLESQRELCLIANLGTDIISLTQPIKDKILFMSNDFTLSDLSGMRLPPWTVGLFIVSDNKTV